MSTTQEALRGCFRCGAEFISLEGKRICDPCRPLKPARPRLKPELTFRKKQVIALVAKAKINKIIAYELHLTEGTIKVYLDRIYRKLGVKNRTELAVWATRREVA